MQCQRTYASVATTWKSVGANWRNICYSIDYKFHRYNTYKPIFTYMYEYSASTSQSWLQCNSEDATSAKQIHPKQSKRMYVNHHFEVIKLNHVGTGANSQVEVVSEDGVLLSSIVIR